MERDGTGQNQMNSSSRQYLKNIFRLTNQPKMFSTVQISKRVPRVVQENHLESFRMEKNVFEGSKTFKQVPVVSNSETENDVQI